MNATCTFPRSIPYRTRYQDAKRVLDLILCLLALPLVLPLLALCALAIRLDSPGPILFVQERIGKGGHRFRMCKFRTMRAGLDTSAHCEFMKAYVRGRVQRDGDRRTFKPITSSQITRVGRLLRKTSLDELPQLINVLRGEMSIVGPRPNVPSEVQEYYPWHYARLEILPGITGLAQVRGRSTVDFNTLVRNDIKYIENQSFSLDLHILWWTCTSVLGAQGAE